MGKHIFGGDWTEDKLERLRQYLEAYQIVFTSEKARYFRTIYVDAFAGTGERTEEPVRGEDAPQLDFVEAPDAGNMDQFKKGSARIALELPRPFDRYIFIESNAARARDLRRLAADFPGSTVDVHEAEANSWLAEWCAETDWQKHRAVVFLDPYGMQVQWPTLRALAGTKAIDVWVLFPLGVAVNRLVTGEGPPPEGWASALTRLLGTDEWKQCWYREEVQSTLFGTQTQRVRSVTIKGIGEYFVERLRTVFAKAAPNPLVLKNSKGSPIYLLCFAAGNPKGAEIAVRIARHILGTQRGRRGR